MTLILLISFTISYFVHLAARIPSLGLIRIDLLLGALTLIVIFLQHGKDTLRLNELTARRLNLFLLYIFLSLPLVTWPGSVINFNLSEWIKVALFYVLVVGAIRTESQLRLLMAIFLACQLFRILEPLYLHITTGYWGDRAFSHVDGIMSRLDRLGGAPFDVVNSNQLAWVIVSTVPFLFYLLWQWNVWGKVLFGLLLLPLVNALLLTGSRSGLLSLGAVVIGMIFLSKNRLRNLVITSVVVIPLAFLMMGRLSMDMQTRYLSLIDSSVAGGDTKVGRINALFNWFSTISHNPLFGNGLGTTREANWNILGGSNQITHNLYIEILQSTGIIGFILFMLYIIAIVKCLRQSQLLLINKGYDGNDWLVRLVSALLAWVFMDLFYSFSCFGLISWEWYFFGGVATVCHILAEEKEVALSADPA